MCDGRGILDVAFNLPMNINEQYYVWFYYFPLYRLLSNVKLNFFQCNFELGYICFEEEKQVNEMVALLRIYIFISGKMFFIILVSIVWLAIPERKMRPKNKLFFFFLLTFHFLNFYFFFFLQLIQRVVAFNLWLFSHYTRTFELRKCIF